MNAVKGACELAKCCLNSSQKQHWGKHGPLVFTLEPAMKLTEQVWLWLARTSTAEDFAQSENIFSLGEKELQPSTEVNLSWGCDGCALAVEPDLNPMGSLGSRKKWSKGK